MADKDFALRHKLGAVTYQPNTFQLRVYGIAQFTGLGLLQHHDRDFAQARLVFQQHRRQRGNKLVCSSGHPLQDFRHIRQAVIRQMRQCPGAAVENTLHIVEYRQDYLVFLADLVQV